MRDNSKLFCLKATCYVFVLLFLSGCSLFYEQDSNTDSNPLQTNNFYNYLHEGYFKLYKIEDLENDLKSAEIFREKSLRAKNRQMVLPFEVDNARLPDFSEEALSLAHFYLTDIFENQAKLNYPKLAAEAQVAFDCWLTEQEENIQAHDIEVCKTQFIEAMQKMNYPLGAPLIEENNLIKVSSEQPTELKEQAPMTFTLYFSSDEESISTEQHNILKQLKTAYQQHSPTKVFVRGHADRKGNEDYNLILSAKRTQNTVSSLVNLGIDPDLIQQFYYGETQPAQQTQNGQSSRENRRVEIQLVF